VTRLPVRRSRRAIQAEWTKLWTVPSTPWLLAAAVALTVAGSAGALAAVDTSQCPTPSECFEDTTQLSLSGIWLGQAAVAVLAVQAMSSEYGTGTIGSTLAANPSRRLVLLAKATTVVVTALVAGVLGVLGSLVAGRAILPGNGFTRANGYEPLSLADGPTLRAAVGTVLYLALVALLSLGVATAVRDTAGAITGVLTFALRLPDRRPARGRPALAAAPRALRADGSRALHPAHHETRRAADRPVAGLGRARHLRGGRPALGHDALPAPRRVSAGRAERQGDLPVGAPLGDRGDDLTLARRQ
jgi:ABC-2 type transport system permease protein